MCWGYSIISEYYPVMKACIASILALILALIHCPLDDVTQHLHHQNIQIRREGITLSQSPWALKKSSRSPIYQHRKLRIYKFYSDTPFSPAHQTQNWIWSKAFSVSSLHTWFNETHILDGVMLDKMLRWDRHLSFRSRGNGLERH